MNAKLAVILVLVIACISVSTAHTSSTNESPSQTIKRLRIENTRLRRQVAGYRSLTNALFNQLHQLQSDITDCASKLPPPIGP